jgi:hypothetical protein
MNPKDPALAAEVQRAIDRRDWREAQLERAFDWLETAGFDSNNSVADERTLASTLAKAFPSKAPNATIGLLLGSTSIDGGSKLREVKPGSRVTIKLAEEFVNEYLSLEISGARPSQLGLENMQNRRIFGVVAIF